MRLRVPANLDWTRPSQSRLRGLVHVTEERQGWVRGFMEQDESLVVEISFEQMPFGFMAGTNVTYLGLWRVGQKGPVFEYQLGTVWGKPSRNDWERFIQPLHDRLKGYRPVRVASNALAT